MVCLELAGGPANVKNSDLNRMYEANQEFVVNGTTAKTVRRTLGLMAEVFPEKTPELERYNAIALYCVIAELQRVYATRGGRGNQAG